MGLFDYDEAWLRSLKKGDVIGVEKSPNHGEKDWTKVTVERVTPSGRVKVTYPDNRVVDFGLRGYVGEGYGPTHTLVPWTEDIERTIARRKLERAAMYYLDMEHLDRAKVEALTDEQLIAIRDMLRPLRKVPLA